MNVDFSLISNLLNAELVRTLKSVTGSKDLIIDSDLIKQINIFISTSEIRKCGIEKIFKLEKVSPSTDKRRYYLIRSTVENAKTILKHIEDDKRNGLSYFYHIVLCPVKTNVFQNIFNREGLNYDNIQIYSLFIDFFVLFDDVISLELPNITKDLFLNNDIQPCSIIAKSLINLEEIYGEFPEIVIKGNYSKIILNLYERYKAIDHENNRFNNTSSYFDQVILLDRDVDFYTILLSQRVFEGMVDEHCGIKCGNVVYNDINNKKITMRLNNEIYESLKHCNFSIVPQKLHNIMNFLKSGYEKGRDMQSLSEMINFVSKDMSELKQQEIMINCLLSISERIMEIVKYPFYNDIVDIETSLLFGNEISADIQKITVLICRKKNPITIIILVSILSLVTGGLSKKIYDEIVTNFTYAYGFQYIIYFNNFEKLGLITRKDSASSIGSALDAVVDFSGITSLGNQYKLLQSKFKFISSKQDINYHNPNTMFYIFNGIYSPISCLLIEKIIVNDAKLPSIIKSLPGPFHKKKNKAIDGSKNVLVYFVGGCTYSEICALRFLSQKLKINIKIATNVIYNKNSFTELMVENYKVL